MCWDRSSGARSYGVMSGLNSSIILDGAFTFDVYTSPIKVEPSCEFVFAGSFYRTATTSWSIATINTSTGAVTTQANSGFYPPYISQVASFKYFPIGYSFGESLGLCYGWGFTSARSASTHNQIAPAFSTAGTIVLNSQDPFGNSYLDATNAVALYPTETNGVFGTVLPYSRACQNLTKSTVNSTVYSSNCLHIQRLCLT